MKYWLAIALLMGCSAAHAVEPAYEGHMGNPEEPALRPYKWMLSGVGALFYQTGKAFEHGNMNTPVLGTTETLRGLGVGTIELGESVKNGVVYKPFIPRNKEWKKTHKWNKKVDEDLLLRNVRDVSSAGVLYPSLKRNDHAPAENDAKVEARLAEAKQIREDRAAARDARDPYKALTPVERQQLKLVPERAERGLSKKEDYTGNLLKLAK